MKQAMASIFFISTLIEEKPMFICESYPFSSQFLFAINFSLIHFLKKVMQRFITSALFIVKRT
jgi:hypothetical protein